MQPGGLSSWNINLGQYSSPNRRCWVAWLVGNRWYLKGSAIKVWHGNLVPWPMKRRTGWWDTFDMRIIIPLNKTITIISRCYPCYCSMHHTTYFNSMKCAQNSRQKTNNGVQKRSRARWSLFVQTEKVTAVILLSVIHTNTRIAKAWLPKSLYKFPQHENP